MGLDCGLDFGLGLGLSLEGEVGWSIWLSSCSVMIAIVEFFEV